MYFTYSFSNMVRKKDCYSQGHIHIYDISVNNLFYDVYPFFAVASRFKLTSNILRTITLTLFFPH